MNNQARCGGSVNKKTINVQNKNKIVLTGQPAKLKSSQQIVAREKELEAEYKTQTLETRLTAIEKKLEEGEKEEEEIGGFKIADLMQAYTIYQQTQNQTK